MVEANRLLYNPPVPGAKGKAAKDEHPDHIVVIKYVPAVGDSRRAIDEYYTPRSFAAAGRPPTFLMIARHAHF